MYQHIMVPVDLGHIEALEKALATAADLAKCYDADVTYVSVTASQPSALAHNPDEFAGKLRQFAEGQAKKHGIRTRSVMELSHDPSVDLDPTLIRAVGETGADLVVMGSHRPGFAEHLFASNAGHVATHATVSVMVVR